ncbi:UvrD-helicase domain-containing protein [Mycobacterium seoulense]|uniref:UvrD-helicase domain-containing protein n=1 Tax=Mycobacterium seoulense TaxID=386911 RepID=UPI003CE7AE67
MRAIEPTSEQILIRDTARLDVLIIAPAGCGKTEALALRVAGLIRRGDVVPPRRSLILTFSNRARDNIRSRVFDYVPAAVARERVTICNFHGFSARLFRAHANVIDLAPNLILPESDWVSEQCRTKQLNFRQTATVHQLLREAKQEPRDDAEVEEILVDTGNKVAIEIELTRRAESRLTYDDLPRLAELILAHDEVAELYSSHFRAVIVDEFQDLTLQQLRIVNRIGEKRTTFAGDLAQGIYGFAGASPVQVLAAIQAEGPEEHRFAKSHRSSPAVLAVVNALSARTGGSVLESAEPESWPHGGLACCGAFSSTESEATWIVGFARYVLGRAPNHRIGIIARTAPRRRFIDAAFASADIPCHRWDDGVLDTETAKIMSEMLARLDISSWHDAEDPFEFLRLAAGIDGVQDPSTREALVDAIGWCNDLLRDGVSPLEVRSRIRIGDDKTLLNASGVHLLTGHVGKGQQFDWVVVSGAEDGCIPDFRATTPDQLAEEARVFAVMISRARHGVAILRSQQVEAASGSIYGKQPSRFLRDLSDADVCLSLAEGVEWLKGADWQPIANR